MTTIDDDQLILLWEAGWTLPMIARDVGCSAKTVKRKLNALGVSTTRPSSYRFRIRKWLLLLRDERLPSLRPMTGQHTPPVYVYQTDLDAVSLIVLEQDGHVIAVERSMLDALRASLEDQT